MKCPDCMKEGLKSIVTVGHTYTHAVYHPIQYDEDGRLVIRDNSKTSWTNYTCSNGHTWSE